MNTRTGRTIHVCALVLVICQAGVAQQRGDSSSEFLDVVGTSVQGQSGQEKKPHRAADLALIEQRLQAAYEKIAPAIVRINYGTHNNRDWPLCSGVIVTAEGHVVTNSGYVRSVVDDDLLAFHLADGRRVRGTALGWSGECAMGLLKIAEEGPWPHVELGNGADIQVGQLCVGLGYPNLVEIEPDRWPTFRFGAVTKSAAPVWLTSSCLLKESGHSIFDLEGRLMGITSSYPPSKGDHKHTNVEMIKAHWDDLIAGKNVDRTRLLASEADGAESPAAPPSKSQPTGDEDRVAAVIEKATAASVRVIRTGEDRGWSGTIVTADGYVVTCGHHRELPGQKVTLRLSDGRDASAVIVGANLVSDVGLMKITDEGPWPHVELGRSAILNLGDPCVVIGYPTSRPGRKPWVSEVEVIRPIGMMPSKDDWSSRFWTSGGEPPLEGSGGGSSGGGVFDLNGRVVGIILGGSDMTRNGVRIVQQRHARVELIRAQWDLLSASKPVSVIDSAPFTEMTAAFARIAKDLPSIAVDVLVDGRPRVLGTIVGSDGRILTKASELEGEISCRLADGRAFPASVQKVSQEHDLAVLKIDAAGLPEACWSQEESIAPGALIAAIVPGQPAQTGVVSLGERSRPRAAGGLGVIIDDSGHPLKVHERVVSHGYDVPLRKGDVLVHVEDRPIPDYDSYLALFQPKSGTAIAYAGDTVRVGVERNGETLELRFPLPPSNFWAYSAEDASRRWWGFSSVFDTDIRLTPKQCGGPVIDRSGRVVGIAIACLGERFSGRYVIPAHVARGVLAD